MARACGLTREASYLWASDNASLVIRKMTTQGNLITSFHSNDQQPRDLAWDGQHLWMINSLGIIKKFTGQGVLVDSITNLLEGGWGLTYGAGHLWTSDPTNDMIYKISPVFTDITDSWLGPQIPRAFGLSQAFPNPFYRETTIKYQVPKESNVVLKIYNLGGQLVRILVDAKQKPGYYSIEWSGRDDADTRIASGTYFYKIAIGEFTSTKKMILLQ